MARGLYHQTGVGRNDMVLHQDHRGRWRIDLVTSAGGNHTDVTGREAGAGPNQGYSTAERAFEGALDEQRHRGLRGKTHVWIQRGDGYESYQPEGDYLPNRDGSLYDELVAAGHQLDHHESDLYVKDSPTARAAIERHGQRYTAFTSDADRQRWLDVPFGYEPFWQGKQRRNPDWGQHGEGEDDYVIHEGGLFRIVRGGKWQPIHTGRASYPMSELINAAEADSRKHGLHAAVVFESRSDGLHQLGNVTNGRYRAGGDLSQNGRRTGILSDGTRVNIYLDESTPTDAWTVVPHSMEWDTMARGEMREMLGVSKHGSGSQWTQGQEGRHLGKQVPWDHVPDEIKRHIERRVVQEATLFANPRGSTVDEHAQRELSLYIENEYSLVGADNSIGKSIDKNLRRKVASGKYDPALAPKAWQYLIDEGAKKYAKEYSTGDHAQIFSAATRRAVAADFARAWEVENQIPVSRAPGEGATEFEARSQARQRGLR